MSTYAPSSYQDGSIHRHHPASQWQSSGQSRFGPDPSAHSNGISDRVTGFFAEDRKNSLPMYKDKPYAHLQSRRLPWWRQRRTIILALTAFAAVSWWFGILSPLSYFTDDGDERQAPSKGSTSSWLGKSKGLADWNARAESVRETFKISFAGYEKYAWGYDEFQPVNKGRKQMVPNGMGWIIVDALDTMMIMNLSTELTHARQWMHANLTYDQDHDVNTFETTIRMLGGLLSAHYLSTEFPGVYAPIDDAFGDDMYVEKATDLADRLLGAYETGSGVPLASVNLHTGRGIPSHADGGASSTSEATSLQLEMKYLAKLTGEDNYWDKAEHVMKVIDDLNAPDGLMPIFIYADRGTLRGDNIRLGSRGDSFYEYLIKQYLQTSQQEPAYQAMWNESLAGIKKHLITYSYPSNFTVLAERPNGLSRDISPKMDHLVCFMPGTIALATTSGLPLAQAKAQTNWGPQQEEDMVLAEELMKTCWGMYKITPTGLAGEITHFNIHHPEVLYGDFPIGDKPKSPDFDDSGEVGKDDFIIKGADAHNLQRPETVESLFYMWRITGDEKYRQWGWEMFESFIKWMAVEDGTGFSSLSNVLKTPPGMRDNMESFWMAETLKYFYLLFSPNDLLPLTDVVFNTEAHPFPRFQLGKLFSTGWQRKPRDKDGNIIPETAHVSVGTRKEDGAPAMQTVVVAQTREKESTTQTAAETAATASTESAAGSEATKGAESSSEERDPVTGMEKESVVVPKEV